MTLEKLHTPRFSVIVTWAHAPSQLLPGHSLPLRPRLSLTHYLSVLRTLGLLESCSLSPECPHGGFLHGQLVSSLGSLLTEDASNCAQSPSKLPSLFVSFQALTTIYKHLFRCLLVCVLSLHWTLSFFNL